MSSVLETAEIPLGPVRRVRRLEPAALAGVMSRDVVLFGRYWKSTTFSSVMQPVIYLLAFGLGLRTFIKVGHLGYVEYVGTGVVATAIPTLPPRLRSMPYTAVALTSLSRRMVARASVERGTKMKPTAKPWMKRGMARAQ